MDITTILHDYFFIVIVIYNFKDDFYRTITF